MGIFRRLHELDQISLKTSMYAGWFIRSLPTTRSLPKVSPDGDGGLQMAWDVEGSGRTLITINDEMLYGVISAGTRSASYLDERQFMGVVEEDFLAAIPA
ncbi:hypothetical protein [Pseudacidovorax sp.]|uniref:hypothetical protein n=1 Tax=Pseudacidovorax sp. TaxID=1934311 RepID=UPI0025F76201|nr:hypothetical protein [Pseudacidovorax sp.]